MGDIQLILIGTLIFGLVILLLSLIIIMARSKLVNTGDVTILINEEDDKTMVTPAGGKLLGTLAEKEIYLSSACGGKGTCGQCKVKVLDGGGDILPTESSQLTRKEIKQHERLACQVPVKGDMKIEVEPEFLSIKRMVCTVRSNQNVASFIKELVLELPQGEHLNFKAGGYIQIEAPQQTIKYTDFAIEEEYKPEWDKYDQWKYVTPIEETTIRAYSMANFPLEKGKNDSV